MKIALGFRGITFLEKYKHCHGLSPYIIDYKETCPSIKENLITPYIINNSIVDIYYNI
jgi:hypothetical protein